VVNIERPITLFELLRADQARSATAEEGYERALAAFEAGRFAEASRTLGELFAGGSADGPALVLMDRTLACLTQRPEPFDPVWVLPGK
jgi:hypothetical protein